MKGKLIMSISAVGCSPIKPQVSFGMENTDFSEAQKVLDLSRRLEDNFQKEEAPETKSKIQTAISIAGALATTFVLGKVAASKITTAFPKLVPTISEGLKKVAGKAKTVEMPNFVKNIKCPDKIKSNLDKITSKPFVKDLSEKVSKRADDVKAKVVKYVKEQGSEKLFTNGVGIASMASIGTQISKVDGNGDGVADIAQKNVNAYRNAAENLGIFSEIVEALS